MTSIQRLPRNMHGRDFIVGDIHGSFDVLDSALEQVGFNPAVDRVISVGDLINRGTRSRDCIDYLAAPWFHAVRGNHEEVFVRYFRAGRLQDPAYIAQLSEKYDWILDETPEALAMYCRAFEAMPVALEIETAEGLIGVVHADVPQGMDWPTFVKRVQGEDADALETAFFGRKRIYNNDKSGVAGIDRVFFGHTTVADRPCMLGNCCFADTGVVYKATGENDEDDLFLTIIDIRANAEDICKPVKTGNALVRKVTVDKGPAPK